MLGKDEYHNGKELYGVFEGSAIEDLKLPTTLKRIEYSTFKSCKNLKRVNLAGKLEYIGR